LSVFNIYLLRHGELMQSGILCGRTDIALSSIGQQQLHVAAQRLPEISQCFSSPMMRCRTFAEDYCHQNGLSLQVVSELQEMNFGDWDGESYQTLWQLKRNTPSLGDFWQNPWQHQPPNGEAMLNFTQRVERFWYGLLARLEQVKPGQQQQGNILVVSHGGVIRYILACVLGLPMPSVNHMTNIDVPYGALIQLQVVIDDSGKAWPKLML